MTLTGKIGRETLWLTFLKSICQWMTEQGVGRLIKTRRFLRVRKVRMMWNAMIAQLL